MNMTADEGYVVFYTAPGVETGDPIEDRLLRAHEAEAESKGARFGNYGKCLDTNRIYSKTSEGCLESRIDPKTMTVSHAWFDYRGRPL